MTRCFEGTDRSYYGSMEEFTPIDGGLHNHMLDEYLIRSIDKLSEKFRKEFQAEVSAFKLGALVSIKNDLGLQKQKIDYLIKNLELIARKLDIKLPEFKERFLDQKNKKPQRRDDYHDDEE